jgi:hypothetical protein
MAVKYTPTMGCAAPEERKKEKKTSSVDSCQHGLYLKNTDKN